MQKYFFDVTDIVLYVRGETTISGIQRVALQVIKAMLKEHGPDRVMLSMWDQQAQVYAALDASFLEEMDEFDAVALSNVFFGKQRRHYETVPPLLARYRNNRLKYAFHLLRANLAALRRDKRFFEKRFTTLERWPQEKARARAMARDKRKAARMPEPVSQKRTAVADLISAGDNIIILGATWNLAPLYKALAKLQSEQGAQVSMMVHDLIPLVKPEHIASDFSDDFYEWLEGSTAYCSRYFANSQNTGRDLRAFLDEIGADHPIDVVPLAQDLGHKDPEPDPDTTAHMAHLVDQDGVRRAILNLTKTPYVLVVGTVETRKNPWRLVQVWSRLIEDRDIDAPKLVFAGKLGWLIEDFHAALNATGNLRGWVEIAERPSDRELAFLYKNCLFTAMVSQYEGWGLPIGEGLGFGKTGVVANNSAMPEVGGDMVEYCDAESINSIYAACRKLISLPSHREMLEARVAATQLRTWDDVAANFVAVLQTRRTVPDAEDLKSVAKGG
ncbi:MAG: glycosyltransferase family 1 protein [Pseudomonadota bacterium]